MSLGNDWGEVQSLSLIPARNKDKKSNPHTGILFSFENTRRQDGSLYKLS